MLSWVALVIKTLQIKCVGAPSYILQIEIRPTYISISIIYLSSIYISINIFITSRKNNRERSEGVEGRGKEERIKRCPPPQVTMSSFKIQLHTYKF